MCVWVGGGMGGWGIVFHLLILLRALRVKSLGMATTADSLK